MLRKKQEGNESLLVRENNQKDASFTSSLDLKEDR